MYVAERPLYLSKLGAKVVGVVQRQVPSCVRCMQLSLSHMVSHVSPLLAVLDSSQGATLVLFMPEKFDLANDRGLASISAAELKHSTSLRSYMAV